MPKPDLGPSREHDGNLERLKFVRTTVFLFLEPRRQSDSFFSLRFVVARTWFIAGGVRTVNWHLTLLSGASLLNARTGSHHDN